MAHYLLAPYVKVKIGLYPPLRIHREQEEKEEPGVEEKEDTEVLTNRLNDIYSRWPISVWSLYNFILNLG